MLYVKDVARLKIAEKPAPPEKKAEPQEVKKEAALEPLLIRQVIAQLALNTQAMRAMVEQRQPAATNISATVEVPAAKQYIIDYQRDKFDGSIVRSIITVKT